MNINLRTIILFIIGFMLCLVGTATAFAYRENDSLLFLSLITVGIGSMVYMKI